MSSLLRVSLEQEATDTKAWYGFDLDGTLVVHEPDNKDFMNVGEPVSLMVERAKQYLAAGKQIKIFTARVYSTGEVGEEERIAQVVGNIEEWCKINLGQAVPVTNIKDRYMQYIYDDRCRQVVPNVGTVIGEN
jgi:hypothetical protein